MNTDTTEQTVTPDPASSKDAGELERIIEAALFATDETLSIRQLQAMFPTGAVPSVEDLKAALDALEQFYQNRGIELCKRGKGWRFHTRDIYSDWLAKLFREKPPRYSRALMETLSIIAYRQPVTRGEIEEIRGVAVRSEMIRVLTDRGWVVPLGNRDVPGHPELLGTTDAFLQYFNLTSLKELPELPDRREMYDVARDNNVEPLVLPESDVSTDVDRETVQSAEVVKLSSANDSKDVHSDGDS